MPIQDLTSSIGLLVISIILASNGGRFAAHREIDTRFVKLKGAAAVAIGLVMLTAGLAGVGLAWYVGLRLGER